jgi:two-component system sensor kinase FixL
VDDVLSLVAFTILSCFIVYLGYQSPLPPAVRRTLIIPFVFLIIDCSLDVTREIESLDNVAIIGHDSGVRRFAQSVLLAGRVCFLFLVLYLLLRSIDETQNKYRQNLDELAHISRRYTMGELATGLAHELNQPLAAIANYAHAASSNLNSDSTGANAKAMRLLEKIETQACRAGDIIRRLRRTLGPSDPELSIVDLNTVVNDAVEICTARATQLQQHIRVQPATDLPAVRADAVQIQQVVVNLLVNALEANAQQANVSGHGPNSTVSVMTAAVDNDCVEVAVSDNGPGLATEVVTQVFEPFFTTKDEGLGVGLAISKSITESHEGELTASNNSDRGATFSLQLPVRGPATVPTAEPSPEHTTSDQLVV